jgi:hypothetical protein
MDAEIDDTPMKMKNDTAIQNSGSYVPDAAPVFALEGAVGPIAGFAATKSRMSVRRRIERELDVREIGRSAMARQRTIQG